METIGIALAFVGAALAVGLACSGSARGVGSVGEVGAGQRPGKVLSDSDFADHPWNPGSVWTGGLVFCLNEAGLFFRGAAGIDWK